MRFKRAKFVPRTNITIVSKPSKATPKEIDPSVQFDYLWEHWKFNADQRLKAFNFFVVFSVFANGGLFSAVEKCVHPALVLTIGLFISALAFVFWLMDQRSQTLLAMSVPGLKQFEVACVDKAAQLFHLDIVNAKSKKRYTFAFNILFRVQFVFGLVVFAYGLTKTLPLPAEWQFLSTLPALATCKT